MKHHVIAWGGDMRPHKHAEWKPLVSPWWVRAWEAIKFAAFSLTHRIALYRINRRFPGCASGKPPF